MPVWSLIKFYCFCINMCVIVHIFLQRLYHDYIHRFEKYKQITFCVASVVLYKETMTLLVSSNPEKCSCIEKCYFSSITIQRLIFMMRNYTVKFPESQVYKMPRTFCVIVSLLVV